MTYYASHEQITDALRLRRAGYSYTEIAACVGVAHSTVRAWCLRFNAEAGDRPAPEGIDGAVTAHVARGWQYAALLTTLRTIEAQCAWRGYPPTVRELMRLLNLHSESPTKTRLDRLRQHGLVTWRVGCARTLTITDAGRALLAAEREAGA